MKLRPSQTVAVKGRLPGDPDEFFEVAYWEDGTAWCRTWCPIGGCFTDQLMPIPVDDIDRLATRHDRLPVNTEENACA